MEHQDSSGNKVGGDVGVVHLYDCLLSALGTTPRYAPAGLNQLATPATVYPRSHPCSLSTRLRVLPDSHMHITQPLSLPQGVIGPGGVQWMTAGRGLVHSEMPVGVDGRLWGFQLWINLPAQHKMIKPR